MFREINERIEAGASPRDAVDPLGFLCECAKLRCNLLVELTVPEYEAVRADPHRFVLAPGHQIAGVEVVIEAKPGYVVVEKLGEAGREAARDTHPRTD